MTIGPTPRAASAWDWLTGKHSKRSVTWLLLGPTIALSCIGVVMVLSASSVEFIGGAGSFSSLSAHSVVAVVGVALMFRMKAWNRQPYRKIAAIFLLVSIVLLALVVFLLLGYYINSGRRLMRSGGVSYNTSESANLAFWL